MKYRYLLKCLTLSLLLISFSASAFTSIPQINIDEFDETEMAKILKEYGSFEVVGSSVDKLAEYALEALKESKQTLNLPIDSLEKVYHENFHGFQNVHKETTAMVKTGEKKQARSQIAFHVKPYLEPRIPEGMTDINACTAYYTHATDLLYNLYDKIANAYIKPEQRSNFKGYAQTSVLTLRKYYPGSKDETGISAHTDFGLLTLVVSDSDGLEILHGKNEKEGVWLKAPSGNLAKLRFYVNVGDWLALQTGNENFIAGIHRVPDVVKDRYSLILFMNPPGIIKLYQRLMTVEGSEVDYGKFLHSCRNDFKGDLSKCSKKLLGI